MKPNKYFKIILIVSLIFSLASIGLFVYKIVIFDFNRPIDNNLFDHFGSFYGGVLGTILNALNTFFIYKTLLSQYKQLELSNQIHEIEIIDRLYKGIVDELNNLEYKEFKGLNSLYKFDYEHRENPNAILNHICLILVLIEDLIENVEKSVFISNETKENQLKKIYLMYFSKLVWTLFENIFAKLFDDVIVHKGSQKVKIVGLKHHNDMKIIFDKYMNLTQRSYKYLIEKELVTMPTEPAKMIYIIENKIDFQSFSGN